MAAVPDDLSVLNQYGVGMKVAACWFGRRWTVVTSARNENVKRTVIFDVDQIVAEQLNEIPILEEPELEREPRALRVEVARRRLRAEEDRLAGRDWWLPQCWFVSEEHQQIFSAVLIASIDEDDEFDSS